VTVVDSSDTEVETATDVDPSPDEQGDALVGGGPDKVVADSGVEDVFEQLEDAEDAEPSSEVTTGSSPSADEIVSSASAPLQPGPQTSGDETAAELFDEFSDEMAESVRGDDSVEAQLTAADDQDERGEEPSDALRFDEAMEWADEKGSPFEGREQSAEGGSSTEEGNVEASGHVDETDRSTAPGDATAGASPGDGSSREPDEAADGAAGSRGPDASEPAASERRSSDGIDDETGESSAPSSTFSEVADGNEADLDEILDDDLPVEGLIDATNGDVDVPGETASSGSGAESGVSITEAESPGTRAEGGRSPGDGREGPPDGEPSDPDGIDPDLPIRDADAEADAGERATRTGIQSDRETPVSGADESSLEGPGDQANRPDHADQADHADPGERGLESTDTDDADRETSETPPDAVEVSPDDDENDSDGVISRVRDAIDDIFSD